MRFAYTLRSLRRTLLIHTFFPVLLLVLLSLSLAPSGLAQDNFSVSALPDIQRMQALADACAELELNTLCFGGGNVEITTDGRTTQLSEIGARLPLAGVQRIETTAEDANCTWGGVALKLQGTAGASQPGMTYVALGNVVLENATTPEELLVPVAPQPVSVNTDNLNFRAIPSLEAEVVGQFNTGDLLNADALSTDGQWLRVESAGMTGWVAREFTDSSEDLSALPTLTENAKGWMQDFTLHTAPSACAATLPSLLVVQTAGKERVVLKVNGTDISIGSTIAFNTVSDAVLGGPDTAETTQMVVIDGSLMLPGLEADSESVAYADADGDIVGYGLTLSTDEDDNAGATMLPEGTGIVLNPAEEQIDGPITGAIIAQIAAVATIVAQQMTADLEEQDALDTSPDDAEIAGIEDTGAAETFDADDTVITTPAASTSLTFDRVLQLPDGVMFADELGPLQLLGGVLPETNDGPVKLDFSEDLDVWLGVQAPESEAFCDDFEVISPKSGTYVLPPESDLTFNYPNTTAKLWEFYAEIQEDFRVGMETTFHLCRPNGGDLEALVTQDYIFPADVYFSNLMPEPLSVTYEYWQLQAMGLILPFATSGQLVW